MNVKEAVEKRQPVFNPHIDKGWFEKMIEENFQLKPETRDEFN